MPSWGRKVDGGWKGAAALILALILALRIVAAPMIMAAPGPGMMAICTGGQIIYISMEDGQPVGDGDGHAAQNCPFFGSVTMLDTADTPAVAPLIFAVLNTRSVYTQDIGKNEYFLGYRSRAPPLLT